MNDAVQCTIGNLCNACQPGQTCTTGASTCAGGGASPSTSKSTVPTSPPVTTSKPPPVTTSEPPPVTSSSTSKPPTLPTEVPSVGNFKDKGCFQDSPDSRVLVADSIEDQSSSGMTVEKCIQFALKNSWQYAGVEFGGSVLSKTFYIIKICYAHD